jgi:nucleoside-diphosphate-sugar epimerase
MRVLVTGSAGHLGEALVRTLRDRGDDVVSLDVLESQFTTHVGSIGDREFVRRCLRGVQTVFHPATLHKPHVITHSAQDFVDTNVTGTLNLLEESVAAGVEAFIFTSTTSVFGDSMIPEAGANAVWVTEDVPPFPKNIYSITKGAAEELCRLYHRNFGLPCLVLRTSRFFPEEDDDREMRGAYSPDNLKANEFLFRRVDIEDAVSAHLAAAERARDIGFGRYIISATTPFQTEDLAALRGAAPDVVSRRVPGYESEYRRRGWQMLGGIDRVYVNQRAREDLGWRPCYDFQYIIDRLSRGEDLRSNLALQVGTKGYHAETFAEGPYPVAKTFVRNGPSLR